MRGLLLVALVACKPGGVSKEQELCARAAAKFAECEDTGAADKIQREIIFDRWRGLCRAVMTGATDQMFPDVVALYASMDDDTKRSVRAEAECAAKAKTCVDYEACTK